MAKLTSRGSGLTLSLSDIIHAVDVDDLTDGPQGTSKKWSIQQVRDLVASSVDQFTEMTDTPANYTSASLKSVRVNVGETGLEFYTPVFGSTTYLGLTDTPSAYTSDNNKFLRVNAGATGVEHVAASLIALSTFNNDAGFVTSNLTHTGEVTGSTGLIVDKTAITNKTTVTVVSGDFLLISDTSDTGNLKKIDAADFLAGGADGNGIYTGSGSLSGATTVTMGGNQLLFSGGDIRIDGLTPISTDWLTIKRGATDAFKVYNNSGGYPELILNDDLGAAAIKFSSAPSTAAGFSYINNKVHINSTATPTHYLSVQSVQGVSTNHFAVNNGTGNVFEVRNSVSGYPEFVLADDAGVVQTLIKARGDSYIDWNGGVGNLGIGVKTPSARLHVNGNARVDGTLQINDTATTGYTLPAATGTVGQVLEVNASGDLVFATPAGGTDGNGIYTGSGSLSGATTVTMAANDLFFSSTGGNVVIGDVVTSVNNPILYVKGLASQNIATFSHNSGAASGDVQIISDAGVRVKSASGVRVQSTNGSYGTMDLLPYDPTNSFPGLRLSSGGEFSILGNSLWARLFHDGSTIKFGINMSTEPSATLHVNGNAIVDGQLNVTSNVGFGITPNASVTTYIKGSAGDNGTLWVEATAPANGHFYAYQDGRIQMTSQTGTLHLGAAHSANYVLQVKGHSGKSDVALLHNSVGTSFFQLKDTGDLDISALGGGSNIGIGIANTNTSFISAGAATTAKASFHVGISTVANAPTLPNNGDIIYVSDTNGTFTSVGFWGYENGAWVKL